LKVVVPWSNTPSYQVNLPGQPTVGVKIIEDPPEETLTETSKIVKVAAILLIITTAFGSLFLVVMSSILLCFLVRKCQIDWYLPQD
jgi:hypothetical protein